MNKIKFFWHPNNHGNPEDYKPQSNKKLLWQCPNFPDHQWITSVSKITSGTGCPFCCGRKITKSNCLATTHPEIASTWHPSKNILTPFEVGHGQGKRIWWKCQKGHEYETTILNRVRFSNCPYCVNQKISIENSIFSTHPDLAKDWSIKNELSPTNVSSGSNKKCWWKCNEGHEWQASVNNRSKGRGCPFCKNRKISPTNSLHTRYPELCSEWHFDRNSGLSPNTVLPGSGIKVWWKCSKNHEWEASICSRTGPRKTSCPFCNESKGEQKIFHWLTENKIPFERQAKFPNCRNKNLLRFDFAILPERTLLIEYNGRQHYKAMPFFGGKKGLQEVKKNDKIKVDFCKKNNLKLLVISYHNFDLIDSILGNELNG